jgi:uncharacterized cupredoxin-like copper-binding protein
MLTQGRSAVAGHRPRLRRVAMGGCLLLVVAACGSDGASATATAVGTPPGTVAPSVPAGVTVEVGLAEYSVATSAESAPAGSVMFRVANTGAGEHQLLVIRSDAAPGALPRTPDGEQVDEAQVELLAKVDAIAVGQTEELTVELPAGSYVLICNVPKHYEAGMQRAWTASAP